MRANQGTTSSVAVIGGGISGSLTALTLALAGHSVLWFSPKLLGASHAAGAMVCTLSEWDEHVDPQVARLLLELRLTGASQLRRFVSDRQYSGIMPAPLVLCRSSDPVPFEKLKAQVLEFGLDHTETQSGLCLTSEFTVDARRLLAGMQADLTNMANVTILRERVMSLSEQHGVHIYTTDNKYRAEFAIICAGPATPDLICNVPFPQPLPRTHTLRGLAFLTNGSGRGNIRYLNENESCGVHVVGYGREQYFGSTSTLALGGVPDGASPEELNVLVGAVKGLVDPGIRFGNFTKMLSGNRSICVDRMPKYLLSKEGRITAVFGLYRNGFAYSSLVATSMAHYLARGETRDPFPSNTSAYAIYDARVAAWQAENAMEDRIASHLLRSYPIVEVFTLLDSLPRAAGHP